MRKLTLIQLMGFLLMFNANLFAQEFTFGLVGGLDIANSRLTNIPDEIGDYRLYHPMLSFNANGHIGYKSAGFWGISLEPGYIQKGGVIQYDKDDRNDDVRYQLNYVQIPLLADFYLSDKISISVGPEFAYLINAKVKSNGESRNIPNYYDKNFELSGIVGFNYNLHKYFDIGLRYNHGLTYTGKITWTDKNNDFLGESKEYNQYFQLFFRFKI